MRGSPFTDGNLGMKEDPHADMRIATSAASAASAILSSHELEQAEGVAWAGGPS
jgi:hypothetical protein